MSNLVFFIHDSRDTHLRGLYRDAVQAPCDWCWIWCGPLSNAYAAEGQKLRDDDGRVLPRFLAKYKSATQLGKTYKSVSLVSFSAGYALVRELLRHDDDARRIASVVLIDSLHSAPTGTSLATAQMEPFRRYALRAKSGGALLWIAHSDVKTYGYASTTEATAALVKSAGGVAGNFFVRTYNIKQDDRSEHAAALTDYGPSFVGEALNPWLGDGWRGEPDPGPMPAPVPAITREVPRVVTPVGEVELAAILRDGHTAAFGYPPPVNRLGVGWSQVVLETGRGKKINNHNLGNVTASTSWPGEYFAMRVPPPDPPVLKFRSYPHWLDSAKDYWLLLAKRYSSALEFFDRGEPVHAAGELSRLRYFLAPVTSYAKGMDSLYREFWAKILPKL